MSLTKVGRYLWLATVPLLPIAFIQPAVAQEQHQYKWSTWMGGLTDGHANGISFRFRKGDNSFTERGSAFFSIQNRYTMAASGSVAYELVNDNTGAVKPCTSGFYRLAAGQMKEALGDHESVPGVDGASAEAWERVRLSVRNVRLERLELPDASGAMVQVYPVDARAQEAGKRQEQEEAQRKQKETEQKEAEQKQRTAEREQAEARQKAVQETARKAEEQRAEAARTAEAARQREEKERTRRALNDVNRTVANAKTDLATQTEAFGASRQEKQDAEADYNRRVREIEGRAGSSDDSPEVAEARRKVRDAEARVARLEKDLRVAEANTTEKQRLASGTTDAIMKATYQAVASVAQGQERRASEALEKGRDELSGAQRALDAALRVPRTEAPGRRPGVLGNGDTGSADSGGMTVREAVALVSVHLCADSGCRVKSNEIASALSTAATASPNDASYRYYWAIALQTSGKTEDAEKQYLEAIRLDPENPDYLGVMGNFEEELGKFAKAAELYMGAVKASEKIRDGSPDFYYKRLSDLILRQGKSAEAEEYALLALKAKPENDDVRHALGTLLFKQGRLQEAEIQLREATKAPIPDRSWRILAEVLMLQGKYAEAEAVFLKLGNLTMPGEDNRMGDALFHQGRYEDAERYYQRQVQIMEVRGDKWDEYYTKERSSWGMPVLADEAELVRADYRNDLGNALFRQGKFELALLAYRQAVSLRPDDANYSKNAVACLEPLKNSVKRELTLTLTADDAAVLTSLGQKFEGQKKYEEAEAFYRESAKMKPDIAKYHCNLGRMLVRLEKWDAAAASFQAALRLEPNNSEAKKALKKLQ